MIAACVDYTRVACNKAYRACSGASPSDEPCAWTTDWCPDLLFGVGSNATVQDVLDCTAEWEAASCDDISRGRNPRCLPPGDVPLGESCAFSSQCATGSCGTFGSDAERPNCGVCVEQTRRHGDACSEGEVCAMDSACVDGTCEATYVSNQPPGAACTRAGQCTDGYWCYAMVDTDGLFCQPMPDEGEPCDLSGRCTVGNHCSGGFCVASPVAGESCALVGVEGATRHFCAGDAYCDDAADEPVCRARGLAGESCEPVVGAVDPRATCATGLQCVCVDDDCLTGTCSIRRYEGESCSEIGELCVSGNACVDGRCVAEGFQNWFERYCSGG